MALPIMPIVYDMGVSLLIMQKILTFEQIDGHSWDKVSQAEVMERS